MMTGRAATLQDILDGQRELLLFITDLSSKMANFERHVSTRLDRLEDRFDRLDARVDTLASPDLYQH